MRTLRDDNILKLPDDRQLCYAEYGDPKGFPIFFFHGQASSRLLCGLIPGSPFLPGVRLIAPDRPGYGQTDFKKGVTTLENWPNDVVALANALGIDKFAVLGVSGGGPYALACAWKIPEPLTGVGVCSSLGPFLPETMVNSVSYTRIMWKYVPRLPRFFRAEMAFFAWLARNFPNLYVRLILNEFSETDQKEYARLKVADILLLDRTEGYRQGGIGTWYDTHIPATWPIPLKEIKVKVFYWHGEEDITVPVAMGRYIAEQIPDCEATFIKGFGHFWIFEHKSMGKMLEKLVPPSSSPRSK